MTETPSAVYWVTYPNGSPFSDSVAFSEEVAIVKAVSYWLSHAAFDGIKWGQPWGGGALYYIWPAMEKNGCRVHSVSIGDSDD